MRYTRTNLSIPEWMRRAALAGRINVSAVLRVALARLLPAPKGEDERHGVEMDKLLVRRRHNRTRGMASRRRSA